MGIEEVKREGRYHCDECKKLMMATPSGAVCPDGHGRLRPGITEVELVKYAKARKRWKWFKSLPVLTPKNEKTDRPRLFTHDGKLVISTAVEIKGVRRSRPRFNDGPIDGVVVGRFRDRPVFVKDRVTKTKKKSVTA